MDSSHALTSFAALGQPVRLDVFRLLVSAGSDGRLAGEIADALDVRQNTMSANLSVLLHAGLIRNERQGRAIRYFADMDGIADLLEFMLQDCCGGRPDMCQPAIETVISCCQKPVTTC